MKTTVVILAWFIFAICIVCAVRLRTDYQPREVWLRPKRWNRLEGAYWESRWYWKFWDTFYGKRIDFWWSPAPSEWLNTWQENSNSVRKAARK